MMKLDTARTRESAFVGIDGAAFLLPRLNRLAKTKTKTGIVVARSR